MKHIKVQGVFIYVYLTEEVKRRSHKPDHTVRANTKTVKRKQTIESNPVLQRLKLIQRLNVRLVVKHFILVEPKKS